MKFSLKTEIYSDDVVTLERAMKSVDADADVHIDVDRKTVSVESWLMPEEFIVAFVEGDYEARIVEA
jgi:copper chaperone CopZ